MTRTANAAVGQTLPVQPHASSNGKPERSMYRIRTWIETGIALAFLGYGLLRLAVGSALYGQETGLIDVQALHAPIDEIAGFLTRSNEKQLIPATVSGYVGYIALMGLVLSIGASGTLKKCTFGMPLIGAFLLMYGLLFVNFQTINPKAIHLGTWVVLFMALSWLKRAKKEMPDLHT